MPTRIYYSVFCFFLFFKLFFLLSFSCFMCLPFLLITLLRLPYLRPAPCLVPSVSFSYGSGRVGQVAQRAASALPSISPASVLQHPWCEL